MFGQPAGAGLESANRACCLRNSWSCSADAWREGGSLRLAEAAWLSWLRVVLRQSRLSPTPSLVSFSGTALWPRHICGPERKMRRVKMKELAISSLEM